MVRHDAPTPIDVEPRSQHFLRTPAVARRVVAQARLRRHQLVIEAGAGSGMLTRALAEADARVVAVERDVRLFRSLRARFVGRTNVECHRADILTFPLPREPYAVVSNVPFSITAALVRRLLDAPNPPHDAWLLVQREAAMKFAGVPRESMFSLVRKPAFRFTIAGRIDRHEFVPPPPVDVALLHIERRARPLIDPRESAAYATFVRRAFRGGAHDVRTALRRHITRRQLHRLASDHSFALSARPSELRFEQWLALFRFVRRAASAHDPTRLRLLARSRRIHLPPHGRRMLQPASRGAR